MLINNSALCRKSDSVNFYLHSFGYAKVKTDWMGYVQTPLFSRLYYVISGTAYFEYNNHSLPLLAGNWYLFPAGLSFNFGCNDEMEHLFFHISISGTDGIDLLGNFESPAFIEDKTKPHIFYMEHLKSNSLFESLLLKERAWNIVLNIMARNNMKLKKRDLSQCVQRAVEYINNSLCEKISLDSIAKYTYVSKCTLTNQFKKELNLTVHEYIQRQKMSKAEQMLKNSHKSVASISEELGFSEQFYFSRCFKQNFGVSPKEYRKLKID